MEYTGTGVMPVYEMNRSDEGFGGQNFLWFILLIFFFGAGGNGFGAGSNVNQDAFIQGRFDTNSIINKLDGISNGICSSTYALNNSIKDAAYANMAGLSDLSHQMASCCCDIKQAVAADGQATRALIQQQIIQELRDAKQSAEITLSNAAQSQYILGQIGKFYPYQGVNPCNLPTGCF